MTIRTGQERIPWLAVAMLGIPSGVAMFVELCSTNALAFTMRKFIADPLLITFLGSINLLFNFLVAPVAAWKSDQIWTPWGRRIPFIIVGWTLLAMALAATPFAPNLWVLVLLIVVYQFGMDLGYTGPWNPLYFEMVPPAQRGRSVVIKRLFMMLGRIFFFLVLLGQFDAVCGLKVRKDLYGLHAFSLSGEKLVYFTAAGLVLLCVVGLVLSIREMPPPIKLAPRRSPGHSWWRHLANDFRRGGQGRRVALMVFSLVAITTDLGLLQPLLLTEQFGYSKKLMGQILTWVMLPEMFLILPGILLIADRFNRFNIFCMGLVVCTLEPLAFWVFVKYFAVNQVPSPLQIILFMVVGHAGRMTAVLSLEPLLFARTPCGRLGSRNMNLLLLQGLFTLVLVNGMGYWVRNFSGGGSAARFDYMSGYLYMSLLCGTACVAILAFAGQSRRAGWTETPETAVVTCRKGDGRAYQGFTSIELLVVVSTIGVLLGLLLPAVQSARESVRRMECANHLKQLGLASLQHHNSKNSFPSGLDCNQTGSISLFVFLLPYLEQQALFDAFDKTAPAKNIAGGSQALTAKVLPMLVCPSDLLENPVEVTCGKAWYGMTSYAGNGGTKSFPPNSSELQTNGIFFATGKYAVPIPLQKAVRLEDIQDGTSNTLLLGERSHSDQAFDQQAAKESERFLGEYGHWAGSSNSIALGDSLLSTATPLNYHVPEGETNDYLTTRDLRVSAFGSNHSGGANFALADGSTRFLSDQISLKLFQALSTRSGAELVAPP